MPITLVKLIDVYAGSLALAFLNVVALLLAPFARRPGEGPPRRILLLKFWGIGSILLLMPVARALRRRYPQSEIHVGTLSRNRGMFPLLSQSGGGQAPALPYDGFLTLDLESGARLPLSLLALSLRIVRGRYDLVIDCEFFAKLAAILTFLSRAPVRIGFTSMERLRRRLYTAGVPFRHDRHVTRAFAELLAPLGIPVDTSDWHLAPPSPEAMAEAGRLLDEAGVGGQPFVAVNPNASELAYERRWMPERYAEAARRLSSTFDAHVLLVGSASEAIYVEEVARLAAMPAKVRSVAGRTSIPGLQALLSRSLFFVTNDSGPLHLAAQSGVPCVALFGPETPDLYGPLGAGHLLFYRRLPCSPCMSVHDMKQVVCNSHIDCLRDITVDEVMAGIAAFAARLPRVALAAS